MTGTPSHRPRADQQFCTFFLDGMYFGVEVERVQEVLRYQELTRVPLAHDVVEGLINLRGQIVTALDLRARLRLSPRPSGTKPMNVVIRTSEGAVSLLVDTIGDVLEVASDLFESTPETVRGVARDLVVGVFRLDGRLLLQLDADRAVALPGM